MDLTISSLCPWVQCNHHDINNNHSDTVKLYKGCYCECCRNKAGNTWRSRDQSRNRVGVELISFSFYLSGEKEKKTSPTRFVKASGICLCPFAWWWSSRHPPAGFFWGFCFHPLLKEWWCLVSDKLLVWRSGWPVIVSAWEHPGRALSHPCRRMGLWCEVWLTGVLIARAHGRGTYLVPKLPNWSCLLVFVHADPLALLLLTLWSGRTGISARSGHLQGESGGTEGEGMAWSSDGTRALQGCREIRNQC